MATVGVFAVIFNERGHVLCVRTNYGRGYWTTPGGRVEAGESPLDALQREVLEETGCEVEPGELIGVYVKPFRDDLVMCFHARVTARRDWQPNEEIAELGFFGPDSLPAGMGFVPRARIQDALAGRRGVLRVFDSPDLEDDGGF